MEDCVCYKGVGVLDVPKAWVSGFFSPRGGPVRRKVAGASSLEALFYAASDTLVSGA